MLWPFARKNDHVTEMKFLYICIDMLLRYPVLDEAKLPIICLTNNCPRWYKVLKHNWVKCNLDEGINSCGKTLAIINLVHYTPNHYTLQLILLSIRVNGRKLESVNTQFNRQIGFYSMINTWSETNCFIKIVLHL